MRLLLLGGNAFLGRAIARDAIARGHDVVALARGESGTFAEGVGVVRADRDLPNAYAGVHGDFDAVIDLARQPRHVRGAVENLRDRSEHYLFVSTINVYADAGPTAIGAAEHAELLPAWDGEQWTPEHYGAGKVTCERLVAQAFPDSHLIARAGLLAGPEDATDRSGYWPLRFAHPSRPDGRVLVPHDLPAQTQLIDARDLAHWLISCVENQTVGVFNATGPSVPLHAVLAAARAVAGHTGELVPASSQWLSQKGVAHWAGERSLPLWLPWPEWAGMMTVDTSAAEAAGLRSRPLPQTFTDVLEWELRTGPGRPRQAGLSPADEADLITQWLREN